jgi:hypothetical protein
MRRHCVRPACGAAHSISITKVLRRRSIFRCLQKWFETMEVITGKITSYAVIEANYGSRHIYYADYNADDDTTVLQTLICSNIRTPWQNLNLWVINSLL